MATKTEIDKSGLSPEVLAYIEGLEGENIELAETLEKTASALEEATEESDDDTNDEGTDDVDSLLKSADPKLAAIVKSFQTQATEASQRAAAAEAIAKGERDTRVVSEMVAKAAGLEALGTDSAKLGMALKDIVEKCGQEVHDTIWTVLSGANEVAKTGKVLGEIGTSATVTKSDDSSSEISKRANALIAKGEAKDFNTAVSLVVAADPSLYNEHRANVNKGV